VWLVKPRGSFGHWTRASALWVATGFAEGDRKRQMWKAVRDRQLDPMLPYRSAATLMGGADATHAARREPAAPAVVLAVFAVVIAAFRRRNSVVRHTLIDEAT